jgi:pyruvate kinase
MEDDRHRTVSSAVKLANSLPDSKLVVFTRRGTMADYVSGQRPNAPIYAFAPSFDICRRLSVNWGTFPHYLAFDPNPNRTIGSAINYLVQFGLAKTGDHLVIVSDMLAGEERFDTIQLRVVPERSESVS